MKINKKVTIIFLTIFILLYITIALVETINLSSKNVNEAFEKFVDSELATDRFNKSEICNKVIHSIDENNTFVILELNKDVAIVQFKKGLFGWKLKHFNYNTNKGLSYSGVNSSNEHQYYGIIPENLFADTQMVKVNDMTAKIIKLNEKTGFWYLISKNKGNNDNFDNINIYFLNFDREVIKKL